MEKTAHKLLDTIKSPADLRRLPVSALPELCAEIRSFLIEQLSDNPGHFASSMGAVELTVALHYVFNTPDDRIVWDVGHQAYPHKLITGRKDRFETLRKLNGISGFPNPKESPYDTFTAGHAGNSISAALGMSVAAALGHDPDRHVVAVIGDASISGGLAFEALNNAANTNANLLIILNDNDMSIDRNTGSLSKYLAHITTSKAYNKLRYRAYRMLKRIHLVGERQRGFIMRFNNSIKSLISHEQNIFEGLNIRYIGPIDGHDTERLVRVLTDIKDMNGPRLLHLRTVKGKGYAPAEADPAGWHAPGKFDPATGQKIKSTAGPPKYQDVFGKTLVELAAGNEAIVGITAAMPSGTSMSEMMKAYPARAFDVGISEGHAVTFAGGMAKDGLLPFVAIYSSFLQRGYDNLIHDVAIQGLPVTFCIDRAGLVGEDGVTHHGALDLAYLRTVPGMIIAAPRDERTLRNMMYTAQLKPQGPIAIRYPRGKGEHTDWRTPFEEIEIGRAEQLCEGRHVAVLTIGTVASDALKAVERARRAGIDAALWDMRFLKPLDTDVLRAIAGMSVITVEDGTVNGGLGSAVAEWMAEHPSQGASLTRLGIPDRFVDHATVAQLKEICGIDADTIFNTIMNAAQ